MAEERVWLRPHGVKLSSLDVGHMEAGMQRTKELRRCKGTQMAAAG